MTLDVSGIPRRRAAEKPADAPPRRPFMRNGMRRVVPLLCLLAASRGADAITAEEIVAKNVEARGGAAALASLKTLRRTGRLVPPGRPASITLVELHARPGSLRRESTFQGLTAVQAWDGERGWQVQPYQGRKEPALMSEDDAKGLRIEADLDGPWVDAKAKGHALEYLGAEDVDGTLAHKVRVRLKEGGELTVWIDPDTWMVIRDLRRVTVRGAEREIETDYSDYEKAGGVYVPMSEERGRPDSPPDARAKAIWEKAEANVPIAASEFAFPGGGR